MILVKIQKYSPKVETVVHGSFSPLVFTKVRVFVFRCSVPDDCYNLPAATRHYMENDDILISLSVWLAPSSRKKKIKKPVPYT